MENDLTFGGKLKRGFLRIIEKIAAEKEQEEKDLEELKKRKFEEVEIKRISMIQNVFRKKLSRRMKALESDMTFGGRLKRGFLKLIQQEADKKEQEEKDLEELKKRKFE